MRSKFSLTLEDVHKIVAACRREAEKVARAATIAVVDGSGVLMYLERPDDQPANSVDMASGKARTAAFRERPSSSLEARVKERPGFLTYPNAIAVTGGVPLFYEGQCVGGVGVSGIADGDEVVAKGRSRGAGLTRSEGRPRAGHRVVSCGHVRRIGLGSSACWRASS